MSSTLIIAIIGAITGTSGLLIKLSEYLREQPKIKIEAIENKEFYFNESDEVKPELSTVFDNQTRFGIINLLVKNRSSFPVTIHKIEAYQRQNILKKKHYAIDKSSENFVQYNQGNTYFTFSFFENFPDDFRLDTFDSKKGRIEIYWLDNVTVKNDRIKLTVKFYTSRRNFKKQISLTNFKFILKKGDMKN